MQTARQKFVEAMKILRLYADPEKKFAHDVHIRVACEAFADYRCIGRLSTTNREHHMTTPWLHKTNCIAAILKEVFDA